MVEWLDCFANQPSNDQTIKQTSSLNAIAYKTSGILERHLVGLTSPEEVRELEEMLAQHPEVREELEQIQKALHGYVLAHQVAPPEGLRKKIISGTPAASAAQAKRSANKAASSSSSPKVLKVEVDAPPVNWWMVVSIAGILGLVAAGFFAANKISDLEAAQKELADSRAEVAKLKQEKTAQVKQYEAVRAELDLRSDHNLVPIPLKGNFRAPEAFALVLRNAVEKKSYLDVRKLPDVPDGLKLQLWVTADGKTENLGTPKLNEPSELPDLKFTTNPAIYFVTLEQAGTTPERPSRWRIVMTTGRI